ncbi:MAG: class I SAM-dependent methyltransferase [Nitrospinaceae bacterium]|jgi:ubiquinone/menaquinone biosynthesis C-methylase UbiE|nr:class I SAM-dependent methyltransferase [Nitrospinaceae bacterium]|tara:strand:- start:790 stop:1554 length:765 start_codon:yes stop_codon:yes gene_type:complete
MTESPLSSRTHREQEAFNEGLQRDGYMQVFDHTCHLFLQRRDQIIRDELQYGQGKDVLELGSISWKVWVEDNGIRPANLHCINISREEINQGKKNALDTVVKPHFRLMDANYLEFEDESFDFVYGCAILHHLDYVRALNEVCRVLKPGGRILFVEPLGINPVGKLVRAMTPFARTVDEKPLMFKELDELEKRFHTRHYYEELFSVPLGVVSGMLYDNPDNWLTRFAFNLDLSLNRVFPPLRYLFRHVLVVGTRK